MSVVVAARDTARLAAPVESGEHVELPDPTQVRYLTPHTCRIFEDERGALSVEVAGERVYGGVFAVYAFPVLRPNGYVSLVHSGGEGEEIEVGIVRAIEEFPPHQADLIRAALDRRYFVHTIQRILHIGWEYGFVSLKVETDKGPVEFLMRHQRKRAVDYGPRGKVLIDISENRYLIPDVSALDPKAYRTFTRIIYW